MCGKSGKVHIIFHHKTPCRASTEAPGIKSVKGTHLYTAVIRDDNTFEVFVGQKSVNSGSLQENFLPPRTDNNQRTRNWHYCCCSRPPYCTTQMEKSTLWLWRGFRGMEKGAQVLRIKAMQDEEAVASEFHEHAPKLIWITRNFKFVAVLDAYVDAINTRQSPRIPKASNALLEQEIAEAWEAEKQTYTSDMEEENDDENILSERSLGTKGFAQGSCS
ncbi:hypothetical protein PC112_g23111 [Phytophthora cactorum]|nr:hypothetical protein PC112_g23111 [Phytophthora cactorum]